MACIETRTITVKAKRDPTKYEGFDFSMWEGDRKVDDETIVAEKGNQHQQSDHHKFIFKLENERGSDLQFLNNSCDVMWVKPGNENQAGKCPKQRSNDPDFFVCDIKPHELTVLNANSRRCKHKFVLNFVGTKADGSQGVVSYDPIWGNGNGGLR